MFAMLPSCSTLGCQVSRTQRLTSRWVHACLCLSMSTGKSIFHFLFLLLQCNSGARAGQSKSEHLVGTFPPAFGLGFYCVITGNELQTAVISQAIAGSRSNFSDGQKT